MKTPKQGKTLKKSAQVRKALSISAEDSFKRIQAQYGICDPQQIQMRILWIHIQALMKSQFPGKEAQDFLKNYNRHWTECEKAIKGKAHPFESN